MLAQFCRHLTAAGFQCAQKKRTTAGCGSRVPNHRVPAVARDYFLSNVPKINSVLVRYSSPGFRIVDGKPRELGVTMGQNGFEWSLGGMIEIDDLNQRIEKLELAEGYESEIGVAAEQWVRSVGGHYKKA